MDTFQALPLDLQILTSHYLVYDEKDSQLNGPVTVSNLKKLLKPQCIIVYYLDSLSDESLQKWKQATPLKQNDLCTLLCSSILVNNRRFIDFFIELGADPNDEDGFAYLITVFMNNEDLLKSLLKYTDSHKTLELAYKFASFKGNLELFEIIRNTPLKTYDLNFMLDCLQQAAFAGQLSFVKKILEEPEYREYYRGDTLDIAVRSKNIDLVKYLLKLGAVPNYNTFFHCSTLKMTKLLHRWCPKVDNMLDIFRHLLQNRHFNIVKYWVNQGHDIGGLITEFAGYGDVKTLEFLCKCGADVTISENSSLINAAFYNKIDNIRFLLSKGANVHARKEDALRTAVLYGYFDCVRFLVLNGADCRINDFEIINLSEELGWREITEYLYSQAEKQYIRDSWEYINFF